MTIKNYTTTIAPAKTIGEITQLIVRAHARRIQQIFGPDLMLESLGFSFMIEGQECFFQIKPQVQGVLNALVNAELPARYCNEEHAAKVAWRIEKDWIAAQIAKIEAGAADAAQVFMPYMLVDTNETLYDRLKSNPQLLLGESKRD